MVRHIVWWKLKKEAAGRTAAENAARIQSSYQPLKGIAGVLSVEVSTRFLPTSTVPAQVILTSTHESADALKAYAIDPAHLKFAELIGSVCEDRNCIDYECDQ